MNTPTRLVGFALILTAALGAGYGVGAAVGPLDSGTTAITTTPDGMEQHATNQTAGPDSGSDGPGAAATPGSATSTPSPAGKGHR